MARRFAIKFQTGTSAGQAYSIGPGEYLFIGSGDNCAIKITDDPTVSATHACIYHDPSGHIRFKDMGSQFGTYRNGKQISSAVVLRPGDRITLGQTSTFQSSWWNALQVTRLTRFSRLTALVKQEANEGVFARFGSNSGAIVGALVSCSLVVALVIYGVRSEGLESLSRRAPEPVSSANTAVVARGQGDLGIFSGVLSAKLFSTKPKHAAHERVDLTPERKFIWDEIVAISRRFGDPPPTAMDPRFVREVERHLKKFTYGAYHKTLLERKKQVWPVIEQGLVDRGLPVELGYIVWVESSFQMDAVSPVGAVGPWQFMPETAREYGLRVTGSKDERKDVAKSTAAAADYFADLLRTFGTERYLLAIASYNSGQNRVKRFQIAGTVNKERSSDFWHLRFRLPKETVEYVPKFMAAVIIGRNPERWDVAH